MPNFIKDNQSLLPAKTDLREQPGVSPTQKVVAVDWNEHRQALLDIQTYLRGILMPITVEAATDQVGLHATLVGADNTVAVLDAVKGDASGTWDCTDSVLEGCGVNGTADGTRAAGANPLYMVGVKGWATGGQVRMGNHGVADAADGENYGGNFYAKNGTANYAVYGGTENSTDAATWAGYFDGRVVIREPNGTTLSRLNPYSLALYDIASADQGVGGALEFQGNHSGTTGTTAALIKAMKTNATPGDVGFDLAIGTRKAGDSDVTERMRIQSDGRVRVGATTLAASAMVHVIGIDNGQSDGDIKITSHKTGWGNITSQVRTIAGGSTSADILRISIDSGMIVLRPGGGTDAVAVLHNGDVRLGGSGGPIVRSATGTPEGTVTAPVGSLFLRTDGGAGTTLYVKESGTGNTGWVEK